MKNANPKPIDPPRGLVCPRCECRHFEVVKISHAVGYVRRRRACRHCGHRITTSERIVGGGSPRPKGLPVDPIHPADANGSPVRPGNCPTAMTRRIETQG